VRPSQLIARNEDTTANGMRRSEENVNEHDTQGGREQREPQPPLDKGAQQLHRTGDPPVGQGNEHSRAQDCTGRLPTHDHDHNERDYTHSDKRFDQLYAIIRNTAGYMNSMCTTGA
jgi:hypothetical protein